MAVLNPTRRPPPKRVGPLPSLGVAWWVLWMCSGCFLIHDYTNCNRDEDCASTHRCIDGLCRLRPGVQACDPTGTDHVCPPGQFCDPALAVCLPGDLQSDLDVGGQDLPNLDAAGEDSTSGDAADIPGNDSEDFGDPAPDSEADADAPDDPVDELECLNDEDCTNHRYCDGIERCIEGMCHFGDPPTLSDGWSCTFDYCDENADQVAHDPRDVRCQGDNPCSVEVCAPEYQNTDDSSGCYFGPVGDGTICGIGLICRGIECIQAGCGNEVVEIDSGETCDDGNLESADGCDADCRWEPRRLDLEAGMSAPDRVIHGVDAGDRWGRGVRCADLDGDGRDELVLWTDAAEGRANAVGDGVLEIRVAFTPLPSGDSFLLDTIANWVLYGITPDAGLSVLVEDVDNDGIDDLIVSTPLFDDGDHLQAGAVWIYLGSEGAAELHHGEELSATTADITFFGLQAGIQLEALGVADYDGDDIGDLWFQVHQGEAGAIAIHPSPAAGRYYVPSLEDYPTMRGETDVGTRLGSGGMSVYRGDPFRAPFALVSDALATRSADDSTETGRTYAVPLPLPLGEDPDIASLANGIIVGPWNDSQMRVGPIADLSGDGIPDLVLAMKSHWEHRTAVYSVSETLLDDSPVELGITVGADSGFWLADSDTLRPGAIVLRDLTRDGRDDLVVLSEGLGLERSTDPPPGRAYVLPYPVQLGELVVLGESRSPLEIWGGSGDDFASVTLCTIEPSDPRQLVLGLGGAGSLGKEGELWVYESVPFSPVVE